MFKSKYITSHKIARRVYMHIDSRNDTMALDAEPEDMLPIFKKQFKRKPKDGKEFGDWTRQFLKAEYKKITGKEAE